MQPLFFKGLNIDMKCKTPTFLSENREGVVSADSRLDANQQLDISVNRCRMRESSPFVVNEYVVQRSGLLQWYFKLANTFSNPSIFATDQDSAPCH